MLHTMALLIYLALIGWTLRTLPLKLLLQSGKTQHLVFGSSVCLFILWLFRTGIYPGLNVHFLWLSALPLVLGLRWAIISSFVSLIGLTAAGLESIDMFGINGLLGCLVPIVVSYMIFSLAFHKLPRHLFIYIFVCAFAGGIVALTFKMLLMGGYYYLSGIYEWQIIVDNYLILTPLLLFPEGMLNGMTITLLIIYLPGWVNTFYDKHYLYNK
ncbi:energy-coupling factor ABC transporter permease [Neptunicella sp. SCSIO 80796]|uniref:energy-coupling factor ABC transporter permease n=1 Tax=Neptunicella plasticusilytica TaxID=3117012 RepID=UPI003A4E2D31